MEIGCDADRRVGQRRIKEGRGSHSSIGFCLFPVQNAGALLPRRPRARVCPSDQEFRQRALARPPTRASAHGTGHAADNNASRRDFLATVTTVVAGAALGPQVAHATVREEVAELAAAVPGSGPPNIFFPAYFEGEWGVQRDLYAVNSSALEDPLVQRLSGRLGVAEYYTVKFIPYRGRIVEDKGFNYRSELRAEFDKLRISTTWSADNPNILTATGSTLLQGTSFTQEVKVTKRSFEDRPHGEGTFTHSEYARIADVTDAGGMLGLNAPPRILGKRRIV